MNSLHQRFLIVLLLTGLVGTFVFAGNPKRIGTAGAEELVIPVGSRGMAFGGADIAGTSGADALYWNPAGLARSSSGVETIFSQMSYIADIGVSYGAINVNAGDLGYMGFGIKSLSFGDIPNTTEDFPDGTGQHFSPSFVVGGLSFARMLNDHVSIGVVFNIISEKIMSTSATGFAVNAGVQYSGLGIPGLKFGVVMKNIGPNMTYDGSNLYQTSKVADGLRDAQYYKVEAASFELPATMEIGLSYNQKLGEMNTISVATDFQNNNYQDDEYKFGAEYGYNNTVFLRGGYDISPKAEINSYIYDYSLGLGLNLDLGGFGFTFDYAYRHVKYFTSNNVITVGLLF